MPVEQIGKLVESRFEPEYEKYALDLLPTSLE